MDKVVFKVSAYQREIIDNSQYQPVIKEGENGLYSATTTSSAQGAVRS